MTFDLDTYLAGLSGSNLMVKVTVTGEKKSQEENIFGYACPLRVEKR